MSQALSQLGTSVSSDRWGSTVAILGCAAAFAVLAALAWALRPALGER